MPSTHTADIIRDIRFAAEHRQPVTLTAEEVLALDAELEAAAAAREAEWIKEDRL